MPLTLTTAYYIRRLIRQNLDRLQSVIATGAALQADVLSDLNAVLNSLYLEPVELSATELKLEKLTAYHQSLSNQVGANRKNIAELEDRIFWILGFKYKTVEHQGTILVVDDVPDNLRLLTAAFQNQGYDVRCAANGAMALSAVQNISPDVILLDLRMAGLDGHAVCEKLKASHRIQDVPILFLSASDDVNDKIKAFEIGGADYITKPFQIGEVLARVHHQLNIRNLKQRLEEQNINLQREMSRQLSAPPPDATGPSQSFQHVADTYQITQAIIHGVGACLYRSQYGPERTIIFVNETVEHLTGHTSAELVKRSCDWNTLIHPDDRQQTATVIQAAIATRQPYSVSYRLLHQDGSHRAVQERGYVIFSATGKPAYLDGAVIEA
ncbi:MAG: response regulator [Elainellaceae cyanobacterium]